MKYRILIVEDHPLIIDVYENSLEQMANSNENMEFTIDKAQNLDAALEYLNTKENEYDLVFLDMKLPTSSDKKLLSGEDLGMEIKELYPATKIIVSTTYNDKYRVHAILKNVNPDGFLIKNDISSKEILSAIENLLEGIPYYSKSVLQIIRNEISNDLILDDLDRKILYELSLGTLTKNLTNSIPLSLPAIEKRKRHLKEIFNLQSSSDKELIQSAKEKGFI